MYFLHGKTMKMYFLPGKTYGESLAIRREQIAANKKAREERKAAALASPIAKAVEPLRIAAMNEAEARAKKTIANVTKLLKEAGNDINVAAPYPTTWGASTADYKVKLSRHKLFVILTKSRQGSRSMRDPHLADIDAANCKKFIEDARKNADEQYRLYVEKLVHKIGDVTKATLKGDSVWSWSILSVVKPSGSKENWKTQMIWNQSKYHYHFPQFPTRKVK